jgi:cell division protein FtsZ
MAINISVPPSEFELKPRITVVGTGGAGGNAVNNMIRANLEGVEFVIANTDSQALNQALCQNRIQLGTNITRGLGAGSRPEIGRAAAEEALEEIMNHLHGSNMVFVTAGMGGGTGTGAAPVIARAAREAGILTVGVVTKPFHFEGAHRMRLAESGLEELQQVVDTLIVIPNQNLFRIATEKTTFADAFKMADDVLHAGVRGITDLMIMPGLINLDFADIRTVMMEMGKAMMGTGEGEGEGRAVAAAEAAISNPLLDDVSMKGAKGVLINITGGYDMTLFEIDEAANRIREEVDPNANIIFGSTFDQTLEGKMRLSIVATGIDNENIQRQPLSAEGQQNQSPYGFYQPQQRRNTPVFGAPVRPTLRQPQQLAQQQSPRPQQYTTPVMPQQAEILTQDDIDDAPTLHTETPIVVHAAPRVSPVAPFIPPQPVEVTITEQELPQQQPAFTPPKHTRPSLIDRITGNNTTPQRPEQNTAKPLETAGGPADENLNIPAFLRRQGN